MELKTNMHSRCCQHPHRFQPAMQAIMLVLSSLALASSLPSSSYLPSWNGPHLHAWLPGGGLPAVEGTKWARIYHAEPEFGTYNHAAMIDSFNGSLIAYWKNSVRDEDQPGQRVLWSYSADGLQWTPTDGTNILFPNMSTSSNFNVALFAEPALHINGRQCAASPHPCHPCLTRRQVRRCVAQAVLPLSH